MPHIEKEIEERCKGDDGPIEEEDMREQLPADKFVIFRSRRSLHQVGFGFLVDERQRWEEICDDADVNHLKGRKRQGKSFKKKRRKVLEEVLSEVPTSLVSLTK